MGLIKKWVINISLLFLSTLAIVFVLEIVLRFTPYRLHDVNNRYYHKADNVSGFDITPNYPVTVKSLIDIDNVSVEIWSNELGCFDEPYRGEKEYVLLVGDSFTWGFAPFEDKWGTLLEKVLNVRVLKCGVLGYGTKHELIKAKRVIEKTGVRPKLLLVGYWLGNDLHDDYKFPGTTVVEGYLVSKVGYDINTGKKKIFSEIKLRQMVKNWEEYCIPYEVPYPALQRLKCWLQRHSIIYRRVRPVLAEAILKIKFFKKAALETGLIVQPQSTLPFRSPEKYPWLAEAWTEHLKNLKDMKETADRYRAKLLFVLIPGKEQVYDFLKLPEEYDLEQPNRILSNFFKKERIQYLDLTPLFREYANQKPRSHLDDKEDLYWRHDTHWNVKGNHLAGLLVAGHILKENLLDIPDREEKIKSIEAKLAKFKQGP